MAENPEQPGQQDGSLNEHVNPDDDVNSDDEDLDRMCKPVIGIEDEIDNLEPDLVSEEGAERRSMRSRAAPVKYNPKTGRNYNQSKGKYCDAVSYAQNVVPKMEKDSNKQYYKELAREYINFL